MTEREIYREQIRREVDELLDATPRMTILELYGLSMRLHEINDSVRASQPQTQPAAVDPGEATPVEPLLISCRHSGWTGEHDQRLVSIVKQQTERPTPSQLARHFPGFGTFAYNRMRSLARVELLPAYCK